MIAAGTEMASEGRRPGKEFARLPGPTPLADHTGPRPVPRPDFVIGRRKQLL